VYRPRPEIVERTTWLEARVQGIRMQLAGVGFITNTTYRELFGVGREEARRDLRRLVAEGFLVLEGEKRGARYRPGPMLGSEV